MNTNEKYMTDEQFNTTGTMYIFTVYASKRDADTDTNARNVLEWHNNGLTRHTGQLILNGMTAGATVKYKHPHTVLYAVTAAGDRQRLSSCSC